MPKTLGDRLQHKDKCNLSISLGISNQIKDIFIFTITQPESRGYPAFPRICWCVAPTRPDPARRLCFREFSIKIRANIQMVHKMASYFPPTADVVSHNTDLVVKFNYFKRKQE
jgi:hypothetical protein